MARANETPVPDPARGKAGLERDLPVVLAGRSLTDAGWVKINDLTLCIPLWSAAGDFFLLRLQFDCYPAWPPSAQFVNPLTKEYTFPDDARWLPKIEAPHLQVHPNYNHNGGGKQLICNSSTLEFYEVRHGLDKEEHMWNEGRDNFNHTLFTIKDALLRYYKGRHA